MAFDIVDCSLNGIDLLSFLVRDIGLKFVLKSHNEFDGVQGISAQVIHKRCLRYHILGLNAKLVHNNVFYALLNITVTHFFP